MERSMEEVGVVTTSPRDLSTGVPQRRDRGLGGKGGERTAEIKGCGAGRGPGLVGSESAIDPVHCLRSHSRRGGRDVCRSNFGAARTNRRSCAMTPPCRAKWRNQLRHITSPSSLTVQQACCEQSEESIQLESTDGQNIKTNE